MLTLAACVGLFTAMSLASPTYEIKNKRQQTSDQLYVIFSGDTYQTIPAPDGGGSQSGYTSGFAIFTGSGANIYNTASIDGYDPCADTGNNITISGTCLGPDFQLTVSCEGDSLDNPGYCAAWGNDDVLDCEKAGSDYYNDFITTGYKGLCAVSFAQANDCVADNNLVYTIDQTAGLEMPCGS